MKTLCRPNSFCLDFYQAPMLAQEAALWPGKWFFLVGRRTRPAVTPLNSVRIGHVAQLALQH